MPRPAPITPSERAELRRLYLAATSGRWRAVTVPQTQEHRLMADAGEGREWLLGFVNHAADAELAAAARNALPRLFAEIDDLRRGMYPRPKLMIVGTVR